MKISEQNRGVILVAISAVSYGFVPVLAKIAYSAGTSMYTLLFLRFLAATVFMFSLMIIRKLPLPTGKEIVSFLLLGSFGYAGQVFCYFMALNHASAGVVSLLLYTYPALVMIGSVIFLKERLTTLKVVSLLLALVGSFIIIGAEFDAGLPGIILAILSAVFYSVYILINSKIVKTGMGIQSSAFTLLGVTFVFGFMNSFAGFEPPKETVGVIAVLLLATISTALAIWSFLTGMEKAGASTTALVSTLEPLVIIISSVIFLSEKLTINTVLGGALVLMALILTSLAAKESI